ncbi:MAG: hypothetical protein WD830_02105 [Chloroflexota bacterium]
MRDVSSKRLSIAAVLGAMFILAGCVSVGPTSTNAPSFSLAPGATPTPVVTPAPVITPEPGATPAPITPEPVVTAPPTTAPVTEPPTAEPAHPDWPPGAYEPRQAKDHVGETATVCGKVNSANWVFAEKGHPTWLQLGPAYPNHRFSAIIWGEQRRAWPLNGKPDVVYLNRVICVTGLIETYNTWTQIQNLSKADIQVIP